MQMSDAFTAFEPQCELQPSFPQFGWFLFKTRFYTSTCTPLMAYANKEVNISDWIHDIQFHEDLCKLEARFEMPYSFHVLENRTRLTRAC